MNQIFKVKAFGSAGEQLTFYVKLNVGGVQNAILRLQECIEGISKDHNNYFGSSDEFEIFWKDDVGEPILIATLRDLQNFVMYHARRIHNYLNLFVHPKGYLRGEVFGSDRGTNGPLIVISRSSCKFCS